MMDREAFLEKYPDVSPDDLQGVMASRRRRWLVIGLVVAGCLLLTSLVFGLRVNHVLDREADQIATEIADREIDRMQATFENRMREGRQLARRTFDFLIELVDKNATLRRMRRHWDSASNDVDSLLLDIRSISDSPIAAGTRLYETGPRRVEAVVMHASAFIAEIEVFVPRMLESLRQAEKALGSSNERIKSVMTALDHLVLPLVEGELEETWERLGSDFESWLSAVSGDVETIRASLDGGTLSREYIRRLTRAVFGLD